MLAPNVWVSVANAMNCLNLVIAFDANKRMVTKVSEFLSFILFLKEQIFIGIAPALKIIWVRTILNEPKRCVIIFNKVAANRSSYRFSVAITIYY